MKNEQGFTLIEMMIVLLIISVLLLIAIPNVTKHTATIDEKGCEAFQKMVESQIEAYKIDHQTIPTLEQLKTENYLHDNQTTCPNGKAISIGTDGSVSVSS